MLSELFITTTFYVIMKHQSIDLLCRSIDWLLYDRVFVKKELKDELKMQMKHTILCYEADTQNVFSIVKLNRKHKLLFQ